MPITGTPLTDISTDSSAGAGDAGKIALLGSDGKIDASMLPTPATGDITAVNAGTGLSGGGSSGSVTLTVTIPVPVGGTTGQALVKASNADGDIEWDTVTGGGGSAEVVGIQYFTSVGTMSNAVGVIGDIAIVDGTPQGLWYKNGSNVWAYGGPVSGAGGTVTSVSAGSGLSSSGTSAVTLSVNIHGATLKATPTTSDELLIADVAASNAIKRITIGTIPLTYGTTAGTPCEGNDARLSDSRNPIIHTQTSKGTPVSADELVIADSAASYALKRITIGSLPAGGSATSITESSGPTTLSVGAIADGEYLKRSGSTVIGATVSASSFSVLTDINPRHYWRASSTSQSGGLVDTITDAGRVPKNFTQTGSARCPTGTDGAGKTYLAPDGVADYYQAGVASDWSFLQQGGPFTIAMVYHVPSDPGANTYLLSTFSGSGGSEGFWLLNARSSSTVWGPYYSLYKTGTGAIITADYRKASTGIVTMALVHHGDTGNTISGSSNVIWNAVLYAQGKRVQNTTRSFSYPSITPQAPLSLFASSTPTAFFPGRLYECWIDDTAQPDWAIQDWMKWARTNYNAT